MQVGNIICVQLPTEVDEREGVVDEVVDDTRFYARFMMYDAVNKCYVLNEIPHTTMLDKTWVTKLCSVDGRPATDGRTETPADVILAWASVGYQKLTPSTFWKESNVDDEHYIGDATEDVASVTDSDSSEDSFSSFISQDETTVFTTATGPFAEETHNAVRAWDLWQPCTEQDGQIKHFVDSIESRARHAENDKHMQQGTVAPGYYI